MRLQLAYQQHHAVSTLRDAELDDLLARQAAAYREAWAWLALAPSRTATRAPPGGRGDAGPAQDRGAARSAGRADVRDDLAAFACAPQYAWPCEDALRVIRGPTPPNERAPDGCANGESGGDWGAVNGDNIGLMQIHWPSHLDKLEAVAGTRDWRQLFAAEVNVAVGYRIWDGEDGVLGNGSGGFSAWSCRP